MRFSKVLVGGSLLLTAVLSFACNSVRPTSNAITNVTVIDAKNGLRENQTVVFREDVIIAVGPADDTPKIPQSINGTGKYLIPGLWDMHVHLTFDERFTEMMPGLFLAYGVTSIRDTGGLLEKMLPIVKEMRAAGAVAPRVFFSGPLLDGRHVVYDGQPARLDTGTPRRPKIGVGNTDIETARAAVAELKRQGVDFIKIYEMVSPHVFYALVEAAQKHSLPIAAHIPLSMTASEAGPHIDSLEHLRNVELDCAKNTEELLATRRRILGGYSGDSGYELRASLHELQRMPAVEVLDETQCESVLSAMTDTLQVPTARLNASAYISVFDRPDWQQALSQLEESIQREWQSMPEWLDQPKHVRFGEYTLEMIARMHAAGVPIATGTDTPIVYAIPGYSLHNELDVLVQAGLSPIEAIRSATIRSAEFFSLQDKVGTIEPGKWADLILLNANPLEDITNTREIDRVISKGKVLTDMLPGSKEE